MLSQVLGIFWLCWGAFLLLTVVGLTLAVNATPRPPRKGNERDIIP